MFIKPKKLIVIFVLLAITIALIGYFLINKKIEPAYLTAEVIRGEIGEEVLATGQIKRGEEIELGFKTGGAIAGIYVDVGQIVEVNQLLAEIETSQLAIQVQEARASLTYVQAELDKLLAGATDEEIAVQQALVESAQTGLNNAQKSLANVRATAEENLKTAYEDALSALDDAYLGINDTLNAVSSIQRTYFTSNDQQSLAVKEEKQTIEGAILKVSPYLSTAKQTLANKDIDVSLAEMQNALKTIFASLTAVREICETGIYRSSVSAANKTLLDNQRAYTNADIADILGSQQGISSANLTNQSNIDTAEGTVFSAEKTLDKVKKDLVLILAEPRSENIILAQAKVSQAEANVNLLLGQISQAKIFAPVSGQIARIGKEVGEIVQGSVSGGVISLIPLQPFVIEIDIAETDIGKVEINNECEIALDAFPEKTLSGRVIQIDPAETIIQGVVYYQVKISFESGGIDEEKIKPGMTAEVVILTALNQDALFIPQRAVSEKDGLKTVKVIRERQIETVEVQTGIRSGEGMVEILSGLREGDEIITFENGKK